MTNPKKDKYCQICKSVETFSRRLEHDYRYGRPKIIWRCLSCSRRRVTEGRKRRKRIIVDRLGGRCPCGYQGYLESLDFHHLFPERKSHAPHRLINYSERRLQQHAEELSELLLLCSRCHRELEYHVGSGQISADDVKIFLDTCSLPDDTRKQTREKKMLRRKKKEKNN